MKSNEAEFIQNRFLVGEGPSSNTCPRWAEHLEQRTSVRTKPGRVKTSNIFAPTEHTNERPHNDIYLQITYNVNDRWITSRIVSSRYYITPAVMHRRERVHLCGSVAVEIAADPSSSSRHPAEEYRKKVLKRKELGLT